MMNKYGVINHVQEVVMGRIPSTTDIASAFRSTVQRPSRLKQLKKTWRISSTDAFTTILSALYGKFLVVLGMAFPMSEVISPLIPHSFYEVFYLYLYIGSMFFFVYMYMMILRGNVLDKESDETLPPQCAITMEAGSTTITSSPIESEFCPSVTHEYMNVEESIVDQAVPPSTKEKNHLQPTQHFGSFYLRMGAVAFGIGSMIYSGLEIGQYFELERDTKCHNVILAVTPATRMAFIFIQMYFIFLNEEQQIKATKHRMFSRFGLMHMIGTNLSVWLNVLIQETKHEILTFYNPENNTYEFNKQNHLYQTSFGKMASPAGWNFTTGHIRLGRSLSGPHAIYDCRRTNIIGSLVQNASPFLFPCTIEYSLICAAILYVVWRNISGVRTDEPLNERRLDKPSSVGHYKKSPHHYSVDCAQAHKGLFMGILFLVLTIISLILFFVLISKPDLVSFAVMEVNICELSLYGMSTLATLIGMVQIRELKYSVSRNLQLDNILLVVAQTGIFIYSTFTIIGGHFTQENNTILVIITATVSLLQTASQTLFILDASKRSCATPEQINKKPGREIVTFLLVTNLAMWAINTLEKSRADSHPIQLHFYGLWAWTIITHVSMPLAIFYRFHSTVCLCEIWKKAYKMRHTYLTEV